MATRKLRVKARVCELCGAPAVMRIRTLYGRRGARIGIAFPWFRWRDVCNNHNADAILLLTLGQAQHRVSVDEMSETELAEHFYAHRDELAGEEVPSRRPQRLDRTTHDPH